MHLYCRPCDAAFAGHTHCPKCGGRLLSPQESFIFSGPQTALPPEPDPPTAIGRAALGTVVGVGLAVGLREMVGPDAEIPLRMAGAVGGGLIAGAGRRPGAVAGAAVGLAVGGLFAASDILAAGSVPAAGTTPIATAVGVLAVAAAAGVAGARIWPPAVELPPVPAESAHGSSFASLMDESTRKRARRATRWAAVLIGAAVALAAVHLSDDIRAGLQKYSGGLVQTGGGFRGPYVGLQLVAVVLVAAAAFAGAASGAGLRHGLLVGLFVAFGTGMAWHKKPANPPPAVAGYFLTFRQDPQPLASLAGGGQVLTLTIGLCGAFGGWLGGQLFPPLAPKWMRNRKSPLQS